MAVTLTENWSSYAENTEVQNITGWSTAGTFPLDRAGAKVNASSQIKSTTSNGCLAYYASGSNSHYSEIEIDAAPSSGVVTAGPAVRCVDHQNFIGLRIFGLNNIEIFHRSGSNTYTRLALPSHTHTAGDTYKLEVDGDTLKAYANDSQMGGDIDVTDIQSGGNAGFWIAGTRDPALGDIEIGTIATDTITITGSANRTIIPVFGSTHTHTVSGTYAGVTTPTAIDRRVEEYVSGTVVSDWAELDGSPSNGTYSGTISVPRGKYYKILTRFRNNTDIAAETERIGFGILIEAGGQSNTVSLFASGGDATPSDDTAIFNGSDTWAVPTTQQIAHLLNEISQENNCVVGIYHTAVGSTSIAAHISGGSNYAARQAALTAAGGKLNAFWWGQGEGDTGSAANYNAYETRLGTLYQDMLTRTSQTSATLPMFIVQLGRNEGQTGGNTGWQTVRAAQTNYANDTANVYISHQTMDLPMSDALHRNASGQKQEVLRAADSFNALLASTSNSGRGPIPASVTVSGTSVIINHDLNGSTTLTLPSNSKDGYEVSDDNFATTLTISSIAVSGSQITLTMSTAPSANIKVRSQQGQDPDHAKMPTGSLTYNSQAVMVEPIVTEMLSSTVADAGSYTLTGTAISTQIITPADSGSYALAGASVSTLLATPIDSGSYALTGTDVVFSIVTGPEVIEAEAGSYALTGTAISTQIITPADSGSYALTGSAVRLIYSGDVDIIVTGISVRYLGSGITVKYGGQ